MTTRHPDDGLTLRLWYWEWDGGGLYIRLTDTAVMQAFDQSSGQWRNLDGYYLKRAVQDPDFVEQLEGTRRS